MKQLIYALAAYFFITGLYLLVAPHEFYNNTPGLTLMGPFNFHFIRDISATFAVAGAGMFWGMRNQNKAVIVFGAAWPFLHSLIHIQVWFGRDFILDFITLFDFVAVLVPGWLALWASARITELDG